MIYRRTFLKNSIAAAAFVGLTDFHAFARGRSLGMGHSRVVVARDSSVRDEFGELISDRVASLLDRAMSTYTGETEPRRIWKEILGKSRRIGIKVNGRSGSQLATHAMLVDALVQRLQAAEIRAEDITVWDDSEADLTACGFTVQDGRGDVRYLSADSVGYDAEAVSWGSVKVHLSKILSDECDLIINVPVLKDDKYSGVAFAMKNMEGVVDRQRDLNPNGCCPALADLNCVAAIRSKVRLTVGDALSGIYDGGPEFAYEHSWHPNTLIVGEDRVAVDQIAWQMIDRRRAEAGLKSLAASGRAPQYISVAADAEHGLGTDDTGKMDLAEI